MRRWVGPNAAGVILFALFLAFQGLCGDTTSTAVSDTETQTVATFGAPVVLELETAERTGEAAVFAIRLHRFRLFEVLIAGWLASMCVGQIALDGGVASAAELSLMPRRRHPALLLIAYIATVPVLALPGLVMDLMWNGVRGLGSPDGPSAYPLLVMLLIFFGLPVVALFLAVRRFLDRGATRGQFETDAPPKEEIPWPF